MQNILDTIKAGFESAQDKDVFIDAVRTFIHKELAGRVEQPIDIVKWIPIEKVHANDYNPNSVATQEMQLLYLSIKADGYTQPIVTIYDSELDKYVIVDGFHRYTTMRTRPDIMELNRGCLPCVVINKTINERMASTVRHNRARGKHSIAGMSNMVFKMLEEGWSEAHICNELGMETEEIVRLKYITGFAKLFENVEYKKAWETKAMIKARLEEENKTNK